MFSSSRKNIILSLIFMAGPSFVFSQKNKKHLSYPYGSIVINFENVINHRPLVLNDTTYVNPFGEPYNITKCKYYITNVKLNSPNGSAKEKNSYHLIDQVKAGSKSFTFKVKNGGYRSLTFLLGVDSLHNVTGAQAGALDPLNDMFWTWNTGYVMAKLEGYSTVSSLQNNIFEYHIGGFKGSYNVLKTITLTFPMNENLKVNYDHISDIIIQADINEWWRGAMDVKIAHNATITSPGNLARMISDNYEKMFVVQQVSSRKTK